MINEPTRILHSPPRRRDHLVYAERVRATRRSCSARCPVSALPALQVFWRRMTFHRLAKLVDVGGAHGAMTLAIAKRYPSTLCTCVALRYRQEPVPSRSPRFRPSAGPKSEGSAFGVRYFRGHMGSLALRPGGSRTILLDGFVNRLEDFQFPPSCYSSYGALNFYPGGTFTHCSCQPSLDAHFPLPIRPTFLVVWF